MSAGHSDRPSPAGWFAHPVLSVLVAVVWLLLRQNFTLADVLVAVVIGLVIPRLLHEILGAPVHPRRLGTAVRFLVIVIWDVVVSNITVARIVLTPGSGPRPAWLKVPLELRDPTAITLLATVITTTPGTVSAVIDEERHVIYVHALDCADPDAMALQIKQRYEKPLMEIFEWRKV